MVNHLNTIYVGDNSREELLKIKNVLAAKLIKKGIYQNISYDEAILFLIEFYETRKEHDEVITDD